jgi:tetratricopeptide (TPR) repeat protein
VKRILMLAVLLAACSRAPRDWSELAAVRHAEADNLIDHGDRDRARQVLEAIVASAPESGAESTRRVLLQDTRFRLARLALDAHDAALAARHADAGLALGGDDDLFVANLLVVRGAAHEAMGEPGSAVPLYQRALRINEALLHQTLSP